MNLGSGICSLFELPGVRELLKIKNGNDASYFTCHGYKTKRKLGLAEVG